MPVLCRLNQMSAIDNNKKQVVIFGHPGLVQVPNQVSAKVCVYINYPIEDISCHDSCLFIGLFLFCFLGFVPVIEAFDALY